MTAGNVHVLEAMERAAVSVPAVVDRLKRLYDLRDVDVAAALGLDRKDFQQRRTGLRKFTPSELGGLAAYFDLPPGVFYLSPSEAVKVAVERDPDLARFRVVDLRPVEPEVATAGSAIPG